MVSASYSLWKVIQLFAQSHGTSRCVYDQQANSFFFFFINKRVYQGSDEKGEIYFKYVQTK